MSHCRFYTACSFVDSGSPCCQDDVLARTYPCGAFREHLKKETSQSTQLSSMPSGTEDQLFTHAGGRPLLSTSLVVENASLIFSSNDPHPTVAAPSTIFTQEDC